MQNTNAEIKNNTDMEKKGKPNQAEDVVMKKGIEKNNRLVNNRNGKWRWKRMSRKIRTGMENKKRKEKDFDIYI